MDYDVRIIHHHPAPLISVIIPVFNREELILNTLNSVFDQTIRDRIEIIVVDDGSTDCTFDVLTRLKFPYGGLTVVRQSNHGPSAARNKGLAHARGDFIQFLDSDDLITETKLELQLKLLHDNPSADFVTCRWAYFTETVKDYSSIGGDTYYKWQILPDRKSVV